MNGGTYNHSVRRLVTVFSYTIIHGQEISFPCTSTYDYYIVSVLYIEALIHTYAHIRFLQDISFRYQIVCRPSRGGTINEAYAPILNSYCLIC